ncbi:MAG TPA: HNH endonuclease domain-containing protein [Methylomirabilota bacterium]|nr:HNH endonuclease domain-containing protein [Methylomirabilota bacterium]
MKAQKISVAFDVGHSSIGWATFQTPITPQPESINLLGCGAVTFRSDDCLASARRGYRRQRRHIRSTRTRIARMKVLLAHLGVLKKYQLDAPGSAWPWLLAARVLRGGPLLTWPELWDVLRWYAHNRGYDGNRRWSAAEAEAADEDTEKVENAKTLLGKHGVNSMAETFCLELNVDPLGAKKSSTVRFKGLNAAFPRGIVESEVRRIIQAHFGNLPKVDESLARALIGRDNRDATAWQAIPCSGLILPRRYQGALLFGQLVPRFDNRIISTCPISGGKVPSRDCVEFMNFRWGMQLANIRVARFGEKELSPLTVPERKQMDVVMRQAGSMGAGEFKKQVRQITSAIRDNLETMLMHPDAKEALLLDPVQKLTQSDDLQNIWPLLPERLQKRVRGQWRRGRSISFAQLRTQLAELGGDTAAFDAEITRQLDSSNTKGKKKDKPISREELLKKSFFVKKLGQRAAFARHLLQKAYAEVMAGKHPKEEGGCLFITEEMREAQLQRNIADQTNNHLVRHRLLILERLLADIIKEYAEDDKTRITRLTIEVNRDLREMSGMTAKEKAQDLGRRIANHHNVATKLEEQLAEEKMNGRRIPITAGLIRKARVAEDLGWRCPYTGVEFEPKQLVTRTVDKDHIVPRSDRASDSLDSLVITFSAINKWKGRRTAMKFIEDEQGKTVPDLPNLSIMSVSRYKQFVESLESYRGHDDDKRRKKKRKDLMLLPTYEEKEFTPRDLTTTSQLVRLGAMSLRKAFVGCNTQPVVVSLPGSVTGTVRKAWKVLGCLSLASPQVLDETGAVKNKNDIRDITHLHHALDACVLGFASHFIPNNGRVWELMVKRRWTPAEEKELMALGVFGKDSEGRFQMTDLNNRHKEAIRQRLAEKRVVQHIPARMDGLRVEQNTWRVIEVTDGEATLQQSMRGPDGKRIAKTTRERVSKLLGLPTSGTSKLQALKGVLVIPDNFGVALDPQPTIVPFHKVWPRLQELKTANGGKVPRVLRNGQLIQFVEKGVSQIYRVFSVKNTARGMMLDIGLPHEIYSSRNGNRLTSFVKNGMKIVDAPLTGVACPTTSSA